MWLSVQYECLTKIFKKAFLVLAQTPSHRFLRMAVTKYTEQKIGNSPPTNQVLTFNSMNFKLLYLLAFGLFGFFFSERSKHNTRQDLHSLFHLAFPKNW